MILEKGQNFVVTMKHIAEGSFSVKLQGGEMSSVSVMFVAGVQEVNKQIIKEGI